MKKKLNKITFLGLALLFFVSISKAQNPIIQTYFTADPAPMVYNDTVYVYTSHDEDSTVNNFFTMLDWRCYSSVDMVNWTDHGAVASLKSFDWLKKDNGAWAPQCIERNGKFYLYVPIHGGGILVLVSDSPTGPFKDVLGKKLVESDHVWQDIDPTVLIDTDSNSPEGKAQAYLYWGNPQLWYVKLNEDMISYDHSIGDSGIVSVEMTQEAFGSKERRDGTQGTTYTEGPWIYKRNKVYYMIYAAEGIPEKIAYSTAPSSEGPWTYKGIIMDRAPKLAFTNHAGIIDYKGNSYFFYHNEALTGGGGFRRSVCLEQFSFNEDGSIPLLTPTVEGVTQSAQPLNPFKRVQAETIGWSEGLKTTTHEKNGVYVTNINNNSYLKIKSVDFSKGAKIFEAHVAALSGGLIEFRIDSNEGELLGTIEVPTNIDTPKWISIATQLKKTKGVHDVYLVFKGKEGELFDFDWWQLK